MSVWTVSLVSGDCVLDACVVCVLDACVNCHWCSCEL